MSANIKEISTLALGLPVRSRALLADLLLDSLDEGSAEAHENAWMETALRRDQEISAGASEGKTHAQIVAAARQAIQCKR